MISKIYILHPNYIIARGLKAIINDMDLSRNEQIILRDEFNFQDEFTADDFLVAHISFEKQILDGFSEIIVNRSVLVITDHIDDSDDAKITAQSSKDDLQNALEQLIKPRMMREIEEETISKREEDVLRLVALGFSNKEIAEKLFISAHTVITHRKNITEKLGIKSISGLTLYALMNRIIKQEEIEPEDLI